MKGFYYTIIYTKYNHAALPVETRNKVNKHETFLWHLGDHLNVSRTPIYRNAFMVFDSHKNEIKKFTIPGTFQYRKRHWRVR